MVSFSVMITGRVAANELAGMIGLDEADAWLLELAPFPLAIVALGGASAFLYWAAPARHLGWRWILPGVIVFVPRWITAMVLFSFYVANFGSYGDKYGALGGVIILLLWFYLTALILLIGGELNAVLEREFGPGPKRPPNAHEPREPLSPRNEPGGHDSSERRRSSRPGPEGSS